MILHRIVRSNPPSLVDFTSGAALGHPLAHASPETFSLHAGLSAFRTIHQARAMARRNPRLGPFIAVLDIPDDGAIRVERTTHRPGHYTVWGAPDTILECVIAVSPVSDVE